MRVIDGDLEQFYVSPFMEMAMHCHFRLAAADRCAAIAIETHDALGPVLSTCFAGERRVRSDSIRLRGLLRHPMRAAQVLGGIPLGSAEAVAQGDACAASARPPTDPVSIVVPARPA